MPVLPQTIRGSLGPPLSPDCPAEIRRFGTESLSRVHLESKPRASVPAGRPRPVLPRARAARARALARARRVPRVDAPARGQPAVHLLRGPADRERPAGRASRPEPDVQGRLPAVQDDARPLRAAKGRLGLPRPAGGARGREGARLPVEGRHRALRRGRVQREVPRVGAALHRRVERPHRADRLLGRHRRRLLHALQRLHRVGLVVAQGDVGQGSSDRGLQGGAVLPARRHRTVLARGRARLRERDRPVGVREVPAARRTLRLAARLDDDALDTRAARGDRGRSGRHLRAGAPG